MRQLAKQDYRRKHGQNDASIYVVIPAYNEADNIEPVLARIPEEVLGLRVRPLVVVDGATDATQQVVERMNHAAVGYTVNRGGGSALKAGYEIALEDDAEIVVTLDADGQHSPEEIERLVAPILDGSADLVNGSRVLGSYEKDSQVRAAGVVLFNWLISLLTMTHITDCSNAFRAIRVSELGKLQLRQSQFHSSEMLIEALKRGLRVDRGADHDLAARQRREQEGHVAHLRLGLRARDRHHLAALSAAISRGPRQRYSSSGGRPRRKLSTSSSSGSRPAHERATAVAAPHDEVVGTGVAKEPPRPARGRRCSRSSGRPHARSPRSFGARLAITTGVRGCAASQAARSTSAGVGLRPRGWKNSA